MSDCFELGYPSQSQIDKLVYYNNNNNNHYNNIIIIKM